MYNVSAKQKSEEIEERYARNSSVEHRKKYAQFFTPFAVADLMVQWILGNKNLKTVLEPAFGLGIFSRILLTHNENLKIKGFEIDAQIFETATKSFQKRDDICLSLQDYIYSDWENKYDGIICNPPYFKFHDYDNKGTLEEMGKNIGCKLSGFTNLYALFLLKSIYQLKIDGRVAYIVPSEFLNSDYGKAVKSYLIKSKTLRHIIIVDFEENVFDEALTTASILLLANDNQSENVQFTVIKSLNDLDKIKQIINNYPNSVGGERVVRLQKLNPEIKWRKYYQKQNSAKYKNLVPFSHFGKVTRGIATGANEYFTFNKTKAEKFNIDEKYLLPCICKAIDAKSAFFTKRDFQELENKNKTIYLINAAASDDKNIKKYISLGEEQEINKRFLVASRTPWYSLENRPPSPIWVSVFNRNGLRFIRNEAGISNLTTFHCIYPYQDNLFTCINIDLLFAYLLTDTAKEIFEDNRREYGNGLKKFEPNDINKAQMLDLNRLDKKSQDKILKYYYLYKQSVCENQPKQHYIGKMDEILIEHFI